MIKLGSGNIGIVSVVVNIFNKRHIWCLQYYIYINRKQKKIEISYICKFGLHMQVRAVFNCIPYPIWIFILWTTLHYISGHIYVRLCIPPTIYGFIMSPIQTTAPYCVVLRWIIYNGGNAIVNLWLLAGSWAFTHAYRLMKY